MEITKKWILEIIKKYNLEDIAQEYYLYKAIEHFNDDGPLDDRSLDYIRTICGILACAMTGDELPHYFYKFYDRYSYEMLDKKFEIFARLKNGESVSEDEISPIMENYPVEEEGQRILWD